VQAGQEQRSKSGEAMRVPTQIVALHLPPFHPSHAPQDWPERFLEAHCSGCSRVTLAALQIAPAYPLTGSVLALVRGSGTHSLGFRASAAKTRCRKFMGTASPKITKLASSGRSVGALDIRPICARLRNERYNCVYRSHSFAHEWVVPRGTYAQIAICGHC
jgi:hypothetical protein